MSKKDEEDFENSTKHWICDDFYVDGNLKVRDHCHITGKYRGSADRDCNIKVKLNRKIPVVYQNLKNYDSYLIMEEQGKLNQLLIFIIFLLAVLKNWCLIFLIKQGMCFIIKTCEFI